MIQGTVNASRLAMIDITFLSSEGIPNNYSAMIDTGFTGYLTLSPEIISQLGLTFFEQREFILATGNSISMNLYEVIVLWNGQEKIVLAVNADDDALVGMEMLEGFTLFIDAIEGGEVRIEPR